MRYDDFRRSDNVDDRRDDDAAAADSVAAVAASDFQWVVAVLASAQLSCSA